LGTCPPRGDPSPSTRNERETKKEYDVWLVQVGDPQLVVILANELMSKHSIYLQPINYPTVPRGEELLRIAPTPHHTVHMMDYLVNAALRVWLDNGLELHSVRRVKCEFCQRPVRRDVMTARHRVVCDGSHCDQFVVGATAAA